MLRVLRVAATIGCIVAAACGRPSPPGSNPSIRLTSPTSGGAAYVEVTGAPSDTVRAAPAEWARALRVAVDDNAPAMLGTHSVSGDALRFTPLYPFDPGRQYHVRFEPAGRSEEHTSELQSLRH